MDSFKKIQKAMEVYQRTIEKIKKDAQKDVQENIELAFNEFFEACPEIKAICWQQFTPYFNDGDECVFGLQGIILLGSEIDDISDNEEIEKATVYGDYYYGDIPSPEQKSKYDDMLAMINQMEDVLKELYGDHVQVMINREGIEVTEYEHD